MMYVDTLSRIEYLKLQTQAETLPVCQANQTL